MQVSEEKKQFYHIVNCFACCFDTLVILLCLSCFNPIGHWLSRAYCSVCQNMYYFHTYIQLTQLNFAFNVSYGY